MTVPSTGAPASNAEPGELDLNALPMQLMRRFLLVHCEQIQSGIPYLCGTCNVCAAVQHFEKLRRSYLAALERADARERALLEPSDEAVEAACRAHYEAKNSPARWRLAVTEESEGRGGHGKAWADERRAWTRAAIIAANTAILQAKTEATE